MVVLAGLGFVACLIGLLMLVVNAIRRRRPTLLWGLVTAIGFVVFMVGVAAQSTAPPKTPAPAEPSSGDGATTPAEETASRTQVVTIGDIYATAKNWDADPEVDGLELHLTPKDAEDHMIETAGTVGAKLWLEKSPLEGGGKGELIQEWQNIRVTPNDYGLIMGATIRLEYSGFQPDKYQLGILEVTLETPDGETFSSQAECLLGR